MRQRRWLECISDYDFFLHYNPGKSDVVVEAFRKKSQGTLAMIVVQEWQMVEDLANYKLTFVEPDDQTRLYGLVSRLVLMDRVKQLLLQG